jgi:hypothetical protein
MGGWWIWEKQSDGTMTLTTECFENIGVVCCWHLKIVRGFQKK